MNAKVKVVKLCDKISMSGKVLQEFKEICRNEGAKEELEMIKIKIINHNFKRMTMGEFLPISKRNIVKYIEKRLKELEGNKK